MSINIFIAIIVGALFLFVVARMFGRSGRPGDTKTDRFPYDTGSTIAPPVWSADNPSDGATCEVSGQGWSDGSDSGSCDGGDSGD